MYADKRLLNFFKPYSERRNWRNMKNPDTLKLQVVQAGLCLPIFHPEIWDTQKKRKWIHDRKESVLIVKEVMVKEASKELPRMQQKSGKANKHRETRYDVNETEGFETKNRRHVPKKYVTKAYILEGFTLHIYVFLNLLRIFLSCS